MKKYALIFLCTASPLCGISFIDVIKMHMLTKAEQCAQTPDRLTCKYFWLKIQPYLSIRSQPNPPIQKAQPSTPQSSRPLINIEDPAAVEKYLQDSAEKK